MTIADPRASFGENIQSSDERIGPDTSNTTSEEQITPTPGGQSTGSGQAVDESDGETRETTKRLDSSATQEPSPPPPAKRTATVLESYADLLRAAYTRKRKLSKLRKKDIEKIKSGGPTLQLAEREELLSVAARDCALERTRELMLLSIEHFDRPNLARRKIREFVRDVLVRHPAFRTQALEDALRNLPEAPPLEEAVEMLARKSPKSLPGVPAPKRKSELDKCRVNAVCCLLLWYWETQGVSVERISDCLRTSLWDTAAQGHESEEQKLRVLMSNRDTAAASISCSPLQQREHVARTAEEKANSRTQELKNKLDAVERQLDAEKVRVERLTADLNEEQQTHKNDIAHSRDEYAKLQGRVLRRFRREVSLLEDGLQALRRTPPKIYVMDDHAERVIEGLKNEMRDLEEGRLR